ATTTCTVGNGATCSSTNLRGFEYLGEFNGSRYYCSAENNHTWLEARDKAIAAGGNLAVVCSQAENDFLQNGLMADYAWIGYSDRVSEGNFKWVTGENCGFTNWSQGEPNNSDGNEDFTRLLKSTGKWTDRSPSFKAEFIMEIPCQGNMEPGNVVITQIAGLAPGSVFPIGMTEVRYEAIDECDNTEICSFKVTVEAAVDPCAGNGSPAVQVDGSDPDCGQNNGKIRFIFNDNPSRTNIEFSLDGGQTYLLNVSDNAGMAMFSDLAAGTYNVFVRWGNAECGVDLGSITLDDVRQVAGTQCEDNDNTTINDVISADGCTCEGTPIGELNLVCQNDIAEILQSGENGTIIIFDEPTASTTCGLNGLTIEQIEGLASGSIFPIGTTTVKYQVTDACGNMEMCSFEVVIEGTPLMFDLLCADDITVTAEAGQNGVAVSFNEPSVISNCPSDNFRIVQIEGISSGNFFPVGTTRVTYRVGDDCGQIDECSFVVTVNPALTGTIGDLVFTDLDEDGIQDANEPGMDDVTVKLIDATTGNRVATVITANNGAYQFSDVEAGAYQIMINTPDGMVVSPANAGNDTTKDSDILENGMTAVFTLTPGEDRTDIDAGLVRPIIINRGQVGNVVFNDANGNGIQENGEAGIKDVFVQLLDKNGEVVQFTTSDDNGMYLFSELLPGDYQLRFRGQSDDLIPTLQDEGDNDARDSDIDENGLTEVFTLVTGFDETRDAGFQPRIVESNPARIGNQVFLDENRNGIRDNNETGIDGVEVKLLAENGDVLQTVNTANGGMYAFSVAPGTYQVMFGTPFGFNPTNQSGNATDGVDNDSDNDPTTGMTELFTVASGEVNPTIDAGFVAQPDPCDNVTDGGIIEADEDPEACGPYDATIITSVDAPTGGSGDLEYTWLASTIECPTELTDIIPGANSQDYDPGVLTQTTYFVRCARRVGCTVWIESDCVVKKVDACDNDSPVDCDAITTTVTEGNIKVDGLLDSNAKVEVIGAGTNWTPMLVCGDGGEVCENPQMIMDLPEGDYTVKVQLWGADGSYCYTERQVTVTDGEPTCTVDGGTVSTNDDTTDLCVGDNEPNIVNFAATGSNGPNRAWVVTDNNGIILNADASSSIDFEGAGAGTCYVYYLSYETITGLEAGANIYDLIGCFDKSNRIEVSRTDNCGGGKEPICDDVDVTTGNGKINLVGLAGQFVIVKIHDTNAGWVIIEQCVDCEDPTTFNVPAGDYNVVIEFYRGYWNDKYCRKDVRVVVTDGENPCEDKDNDGICVAEDCNDDDATVGARQTPGTSCDDGNALTVNDVVLADGCSCAGEEETTPEKEICIEREVFNTDNCQFNIIYGLYLNLDGYDKYYEVSDA
ncbi:MAG: SdrD B-like domain-containing protein, partial [Saprospiraceae bacterium]